VGISFSRSGFANTCDLCPVRTLTPYGDAPSLVAEIARLRTGTRQLRARRTLYREGEPIRDVYTLFDGWAIRFKILPDGRRQILTVLLPGDAISLPSLWTDRLDFSVQALTAVSLCVFDRVAMIEFLRSRPDLEWRIGRLLAREVGLLEQRLTDLGRCTAHERIARLIIRLYLRLAERNATDGLSFEFPLRQQHIGDALGLTAVHVSRVLRELRAARLIERNGPKLTILDYDGLKAVASAATGETGDAGQA
jgi:CRP/FNR family transcriptional regulator